MLYPFVVHHFHSSHLVCVTRIIAYRMSAKNISYLTNLDKDLLRTSYFLECCRLFGIDLRHERMNHYLTITNIRITERIPHKNASEEWRDPLECPTMGDPEKFVLDPAIILHVILYA